MAAVEIRVELEPACRAAISESLSDLSILIGRVEADRLPDGISGALSELGVTSDDLCDLVTGETVGNSTTGAGKLDGFQFNAANGYLKLFSALARNADADPVCSVHGWPVLSPDAREAILTIARGESRI